MKQTSPLLLRDRHKGKPFYGTFRAGPQQSHVNSTSRELDVLYMMTGVRSKASQSRPRISARDATFTTVLVSPERVKFTIHEDLLVSHSPFFRAALTGNSQEAQDKSTTLEEEDPLTFEFVVYWLCHKRLPHRDDAPVEPMKAWAGRDDLGGLETGNLIHVYVFCGKYDFPSLKKAALDDLYNHIMDSAVGLASGAQIGCAFDNLPGGSPLCRYLVDELCHFATAVVWENLAASSYPLGFLRKVLCRYTEYAHGDQEWDRIMPLCDYHDHKDWNEREACEARLNEC